MTTTPAVVKTMRVFDTLAEIDVTALVGSVHEGHGQLIAQ